MEFTIRATTDQEKLYLYSQSSQIDGQTGCIGHLRAYFDGDGAGFGTSWFDHVSRLNTDVFRADLDALMAKLRKMPRYGGFLRTRRDMSAWCYKNALAFEGVCSTEFGARVDTEQYAYLMRMNPSRGEYSLYCYCFEKQRLDNHLQRSQQGIRFIDPDYQELFRIQDGDKIRLLHPDGERRDQVCRYIDDYHLEVGNNIFHICQFAEWVQKNNIQVIPLRSSDPRGCNGNGTPARPERKDRGDAR